MYYYVDDEVEYTGEQLVFDSENTGAGVMRLASNTFVLYSTEAFSINLESDNEEVDFILAAHNGNTNEYQFGESGKNENGLFFNVEDVSDFDYYVVIVLRSDWEAASDLGEDASDYAHYVLTFDEVIEEVLFKEVTVYGNGQEIVDGQTAVSVNDDTEYGEVDITTGSEIKTYTITNAGNDELTIGTVESNDTDFAITQPGQSTLAPEESTTFTVTFDPAAVGDKEAMITILNDDADEGEYTFIVEGVGAEVVVEEKMPEVTVKGNDEEIVDGQKEVSEANDTEFGDVDITTEKVTYTYTITNEGTDDLTIMSVSSDNKFFEITQPSTTTVAPGGETTFTITFIPEDLGDEEAMITIINNDEDEGVYTFAVEGEGTGEPLSVTEQESGAVTIYPNPMTKGNSIALSSLDNVVSVKVISSLGVEVLSTNEVANLDVSLLSVGSYSVIVIDNQGRRNVQRLIIH